MRPEAVSDGRIDVGFKASARSQELRIQSVGQGVEVRVGKRVVADTTPEKAELLAEWLDRYGDDMHRLGRKDAGEGVGE